MKIAVLALLASATPLLANPVGAPPVTADYFSVNPNVHWPDANSASPRNGTFVPRQNIVMVHAGMTKQQIYPLLNVPNFSEGFFVRHWNYLLNIKIGGQSDIKQCQIQINFDRHARVTAVVWQEQICLDNVREHSTK